MSFGEKNLLEKFPSFHQKQTGLGGNSRSRLMEGNWVSKTKGTLGRILLLLC
jgi:hypothetical protein